MGADISDTMDITACRTDECKGITGIIRYGMFRNHGHQHIVFRRYV